MNWQARLALLFCLHTTRCIAQTCNFTAGQDYSTTAGGTVTATSEEACCKACFAMPDCKVGVFQNSSNKCFLKAGVVQPHQKDGVTSCIARSPPPPAPPFDCSRPGSNCAGRIGATHWNPCYYIRQQDPVLIDGAKAVASMGSRVIKVAAFSPAGNYPFNSPLWEGYNFTTALEMVQHPYYRQLWNMTEFDTYVLIAYSTVGGIGGGDISYWTQGISESQIEEETQQLKDAAKFLLSNYGHMGKTFVFENWEGDWASRHGSYDPKKPATPLALVSMRKWLAARQAGVTQARVEYLSTIKIGSANVGNVFFSAEVNLVQESRTSGVPNMINQVIPYVKLDMVSYSSYDTESNPETFVAALDFIAAQHNRTDAAPPGHAAVFVAEYGMGFNLAPNATVAFTIQNVIDEAMAWGAGYVLFWETYDNECTGGIGCTAGRCHDKDHPVTNPADLHGFWLIRPDGSEAWSYTYLKGLISQSTSNWKLLE